jgi:chromosome segregation ATPase
VDPSDIENTDGWLGCPTPLETCRHQLALYENEFEELNLQLRQARERIFRLVEMYAEASMERDTLRVQVPMFKNAAAEANRRACDIETKNAWEMMANRKEIAYLYDRLRAATGKDLRIALPDN